MAISAIAYTQIATKLVENDTIYLLLKIHRLFHKHHRVPAIVRQKVALLERESHAHGELVAIVIPEGLLDLVTPARLQGIHREFVRGASLGSASAA